MQTDRPVGARGPIAWMANNSVAANLLMFFIVVCGIAAVFTMKQEIFPDFDLDVVRVSVPYPGASPEEVEQGIVLAVEEEIRGIDGVKRVTGSASEGKGSVSAELLLGADAERVLSDVKNKVDGITSFPEEAEEPTIEISSASQRVISLIISGDEDMRTLHDIAEKTRAALLASEDITQVEILGVRPLEISIEIPREKLEAFGLSLDQVAAQIRASSVELPGGGIDTKSGELLVRVSDRKLRGADFENIVLKGTAGGSNLLLNEIATITDGYEDTDKAYFFDGRPAVRVTAYRVGDETPQQVSDAARAYAKVLRTELPSSVSIDIWGDDAELLQGRIDLLLRNASLGLVLVVVILALFLRRQLAAWVALGIPISFLGAFITMQLLGVSINMISLFALIVTLGMVVDDAIVVAEYIFVKRSEGMKPLQAAIAGAQKMAVPVTFSILTTLAAFAPLFFIPGVLGKIFSIIPMVVVSVLMFSLLESFFVLPAHLAHSGGDNRAGAQGARGVWARVFWPVDRTQAAVSRWLHRFTERRYKPLVRTMVRARYTTLAGGFAILIVVLSAVIGGLVPFVFFPSFEADIVTASARLPYGTALERTEEVQRKLEAAAHEAIRDSGGKKYLRGILARVGEGAGGGTPDSRSAAPEGSHLVTVELNLVPIEARQFSAATFAERWRKKLPPIAGVESLVVSAESGPSAGAAVDVQLTHANTKILASASEDFVAKLKSYSGLTNIENSFAAGKPQIDFRLKPKAVSLGLSNQEIASTLRASFFGAEALREQRGRNELKVMVRLPAEQRSSEKDLESLQVPLPGGGFVPLNYVADLERGHAATTIEHEEGQRVVSVSAELAAGTRSARSIIESLESAALPELQSRYDGLGYKFVGQEREQADTMSSLGPGFAIALMAIFTLLAVPFRSYVQPIVIMTAIPFGLVGAIVGHILLGYELNMISILGIIAASGVVVNDSLVYIDAVNDLRRGGMGALEATVQGGANRMRPILLTSLTTFLGLMPMIFETSPQARFLIPMAISLGFGALFVTFICLLLVPAMYMMVEDLRIFFAKVFGRNNASSAALSSDAITTAPSKGAL